jgi:hypothetical protein
MKRNHLARAIVWSMLAASMSGAPRLFQTAHAQSAPPAQPQPLTRPPQVVTTNPSDRPSPSQPHQTQGVEYFIGTWNVTWNGRESPLTAGPRAGKVTFTRLGDSNFLEVRGEGTIDGAGPYKESGVAGWSPAGKVLTIQEKLASGIDVLSVGDWSSAIAIRFEGQPVKVGGQTLRLRRIFNIVSPAAFAVIEEVSTDGGPFSRLGTGDFRKAQ